MHPTLPPIYSLSRRLIYQPQAFFQDILCSVDVPVVMNVTLWAHPVPDRQILRLRILEFAAAANLAAGKESPDFNQGFMLPGSFVFQLTAHLAPGAVCDCLGQVMIL